MPIGLKGQEPVKLAQTPEFKALQDKVNAAKAVLDEVMTAIAALESNAPQADQGAPSAGQAQAVQPQAGVQESIKYNEDTTLARIVQLTGK